MKKLLIIFFFVLAVSCKQDPQQDSVLVADFQQTKAEPNFDWLLGNWRRTNEPENRTTFEHWERKNNSEYIGFGYTMKNKDTIWQERIKLIKINEKWSFNVTVKEEAEPTRFPLTTIENGKFICENQTNEFPKKIEYWAGDDKLYAKISGNDMEVFFDFEKMEE